MARASILHAAQAAVRALLLPTTLVASLCCWALPVRADGAATPPPAAASPAETLPASGLIDDTDKAWVWSGMVPYTDALLHGGSGHAGGPGTYGTYTFHGTAVDVFGLAAPSIVVDGHRHVVGRARVVLDGKEVSVATMTSDKPQYGQVVAHVTGLASANHVVEVYAESDWIVVDYIQATITPVGPAAYNGASAIPEGDYALLPRNNEQIFLGQPKTSDYSLTYLVGRTNSAQAVWHITPTGPDTYALAPTSAPNQVLSVLGPGYGSCSGFQAIGLYHDTGNPKQRWKIGMVDSQYVYLAVSDDPTSHLNICNNGSDPGAQMIAYQHSDSYYPNERWRLIRVK